MRADAKAGLRRMTAQARRLLMTGRTAFQALARRPAMFEEPVDLRIVKSSAGPFSSTDRNSGALMAVSTEGFGRMTVRAYRLHGEGLRSMADQEIRRVISRPGLRRKRSSGRVRM